MPLAPLIVCERTGQWALAWRKSLRATGVRVIETRSMDECRQRLSASSVAAVSLQWRADTADSILDLLARWDEEHPQALAIVTAARGPAEIEELVREAGATWFVNGVRQLPPVAAAVARQAARQPQLELSVQDQIWGQLPWDRAG